MGETANTIQEQQLPTTHREDKDLKNISTIMDYGILCYALQKVNANSGQPQTDTLQMTICSH